MRTLALLLALLLASPASATWEASGADADTIDCGSNAAFDDMASWTALAWVWIDTLGTASGLFIASKNSAGTLSFLHYHGTNDDLRSISIRATTNSSVESTTSTLTTGSWLFLASRYTSGRAGTCTTGDQTGCDLQVFKGDLSTAAAQITGTYNAMLDGSGAHTTDATAVLDFGGRASSGTSSMDGRMGRAMVVAEELTLDQIRALQFAPLSAWNMSTTARMIVQPVDASATTPDLSGQARGPGTAGACSVTGGAVAAGGLPLQ